MLHREGRSMLSDRHAWAELAFATPRKLPKPRDLKGRVVVLDVAFASEAKATSSTTTRPLRSRGLGSLRGVAKASSAHAWRSESIERPSRCSMLTMSTALSFDQNGLIPVIVQDYLTGEIRM